MEEKSNTNLEIGKQELMGIRMQCLQLSSGRDGKPNIDLAQKLIEFIFNGTVPQK